MEPDGIEVRSWSYPCPSHKINVRLFDQDVLCQEFLARFWIIWPVEKDIILIWDMEPCLQFRNLLAQTAPGEWIGAESLVTWYSWPLLRQHMKDIFKVLFQEPANSCSINTLLNWLWEISLLLYKKRVEHRLRPLCELASSDINTLIFQASLHA